MTLVVRASRTGAQAFFLVVLLTTSVFLLAPSEAGFEDPDDLLARAVLKPATVWADDAAYVIGGRGADDRIQRYDPETGTTTLWSTRLPHGIVGGSAVWDGQAIYVFGGRKSSDFLDTVYRIDPATQTVTKMGATLVEPLAGTTAVWAGDAAYVLGGYRDCLGDGCYLYTDAIQRYDPETDTLVPMTTTLWHRVQAMGAVWNGEHIVVIGGHQCVAPGYTCRYADLIERYDPATDEMVPTIGRLSLGTVELHALWDGQSIFLVSGTGFDRTTNRFHDYKEIRRLEFDGPDVTITDTASALPYTDDGFGVVWTGTRVLMLGGRACAFNGICNESDKVWHYDPRPMSPSDLSAQWGDRVGEVRLEWSPAAPEAYPVSGYRIYRGTSPETLRLMAEVDASTTAYDDAPFVPVGSYHYAVTTYDEGGYESAIGDVQRSTPALLPSLADRDGNGLPDGLEYL